MHIAFLGARLPLTKTFLMSNGVVTATPYPQVSRVTSHHHTFTTLNELQALLLAHGAQGHCLFNGQLEHPLQDESRAGKTLKVAKDWIVFDFDKVRAKDHAEVVAKYLPPECQQVSYIAQLSASMWRPDTRLWSGHIYMLLKQPIEDLRLKQWVEWINFNIKPLTDQITLSDSLQALHWPLDRTAAYSSKIIYIAPPRCHGFTPTVVEPISLTKKKNPTLHIGDFNPIDSFAIRQKINELRRAVNEPEIDYEITVFNGEEVLRNAGLVDIQGIRASGDHYIRFNLNGGDSYAYFIDLRNPGLIHNFKGEPALRTDEAAPELYKALRKAAPRALAKPALEEGADVLAFYATNQASQIKIGTHLPISRALTLNNSTDSAARAWMAEYGLVQKGHFPHLDVVYDPTSDVQYIAGATSVNTFEASPYMARAKSVATSSTLADLPPTINRIIRSILGSPEDYVITHFVNWLAFIFQFRKKTGTAWVLNGTTGTGKGLLVATVLRPLFGAKNVVNKQFHELNGEFNGFLADNLITVFEEADINAAVNASTLMAKIKHYITDSPLQIRKMRTDAFEVENFSNFIFHTNERKPIIVSGDDRRFNFGERQEVKLNPTPNELKTLFDGVELEAFADVLQRWPVDKAAVANPIDTQARADAHEATSTINQLIADAIVHGDLQFFLERTPSETEAAADYFNRFNPIGLYKAKLDTYIEAAINDAPMVLGDDDLFVLFRTLITDTKYFQDTKTWRKRHYKTLGLNVDQQQRMPGTWDKRTRGIRVQWQKPDVSPTAPPPPQKADATVTSIKKGRKPRA